ncbi:MULTISPECIES: TonB-dependent receptor [unclassified Brenneria]|uniref:TonB-dependent receptor n=1 Tax=unclassified Brenneria TaxID=2634434 RepID=UPI0029C39F0A|nr:MULTISPECIES: TonB-dependent receptor [unclassified Brenneria]MDX5627202.1 TonB-dependent receptor [Brenneria sp. L3-3Z]MDX5694643.1 TonB-dependent receptor [Brenneria sp. L4-2C]
MNKLKIKKHLFYQAICIGFSGAACSLSYGEESVIMVTADKTEQQAEEVPISLSTFFDDDLHRQGIEDLETLARKTPSFSFQSTGQSGFNPPVVRGLTSYATTFSSSMLMMVDGVPTIANQGFENSLVGVERVEVLRGPQSALYGKNAEGGVLNIYTRQPDDTPYARVDGELGSRDKHVLRLDIAHPLIEDTLYVGIAGQLREQDGFIHNRYSGGWADDRKSYDGRAVIRWTPDENSDISLRYSHLNYRDGGSLWGSVTAPRYEVRSGTSSWNHSEGETFSLDVAHQFDSGVSLRSITAKTDYYDKLRQDTDFMPAERFFMQRDFHLSNLSQELRLSGEHKGAKWLVGAYADKTDNDLSFTNKTPLRFQTIDPTLEGRSVSLFGQWLQPITSQWSFTLGGRIEQDRAEIKPENASTQSRHWQQFSPKASLQYQWRPEQNLYLSYSEGVRAGGFNPFLPSVNYPAYSPEKVRSYEAGVKGSVKNLRYSVAAYYMQINDMQVQQYIGPGVTSITNAATAYSSGLEASFDYWLNEQWSVDGAVGLNRTRFKHYQDGDNNYDGNKNPYAPDLTWHIGVRYDADSWYADASLDGVGDIYLDPANQYRRASYQLLNLSASYPVNQHLTLSAYGQNVTDKHYDAVGYMNGNVTVYNPPRELGMRVSYEF